jgi:hypothetical protein
MKLIIPLPASYSSILNPSIPLGCKDIFIRQRLKCDGTRAETRFRLSAKRTSPFKSAEVSVQSTTGSRGVHISGSNGSNAGYTTFRGTVKGTGYPLHLPVSPSFPPLQPPPPPCVTLCHHISTDLYQLTTPVSTYPTIMSPTGLGC